MSHENIFITRKIHQEAMDLLHQACTKNAWTLKIWPHINPPTPAELLIESKDASAILSMVTDKIDRNFLATLPRLKIIANHAVGVDNIDVEFAHNKKIAVTNTPDVLTDATAELGIILILNLLRKIPNAIRKVKSQNWQSWGPLDDLGLQIGGYSKTHDAPLFGIYGMGRIGEKIGKILANGFGARVAYTNTTGAKDKLSFKAEWMEPEELVKKCQVLIVTCPANPQTVGLFNYSFLKNMPIGSYFINISRGNLHCETSLLKLLEENHLEGVGLDVTNPEPATWGQNPLLGDSRTLITPHIGSATTLARREMALLAAKNIIKYLESGALISSVALN